MVTAALPILKSSTFGRRTAEEEREQLKAYFVQTEQWRQVFSGEIDVVYGPKGSGKSAIYSLVLASESDLLDRNIIAIPAENPQGAPAFQVLSKDAPHSEYEFVSLWKLYIAALCAKHFKEFGVKGPSAERLIDVLEGAKLIPTDFTLAKAIRYAFDYVKKLARVSSLEGGIEIDQATGLPKGLTGKIALREPSAEQADLGIVSVDDLIRFADDALEASTFTFWIMLDRLDVAFVDKPELEVEALRALFKTYLDIKGFKNVRLKLFLRTDIWNAITSDGFREASHIERALTISWSDDDLMNLIVRRALANESIASKYGVAPEELLADFEKQAEFLYRMFPAQVDSGPNKPTTFNWIIGRTRDASQQAAPRELIHFLNELRDVQIGRLERGMATPAGETLFEQVSFKEALPSVSKTRLEQTIYAEFPKLKGRIEALREQRATQTILSLGRLWKCSEAEAASVADELVGIGFFERQGGAKQVWRVPFLYRPALGLIQGNAEAQVQGAEAEEESATEG